MLNLGNDLFDLILSYYILLNSSTKFMQELEQRINMTKIKQDILQDLFLGKSDAMRVRYKIPIFSSILSKMMDFISKLILIKFKGIIFSLVFWSDRARLLWSG